MQKGISKKESLLRKAILLNMIMKRFTNKYIKSLNTKELTGCLSELIQAKNKGALK